MGEVLAEAATLAASRDHDRGARPGGAPGASVLDGRQPWPSASGSSAAGMTLQAICDTLNAEHPHAAGRRQWRPTSLRSVLR